MLKQLSPFERFRCLLDCTIGMHAFDVRNFLKLDPETLLGLAVSDGRYVIVDPHLFRNSLLRAKCTQQLIEAYNVVYAEMVLSDDST